MRCQVQLILFITLAGTFTASQDIHLCSLRDKELSKCLVSSIQNIIPYLVKGIPKLGVFPIDPLHIDLLDLSNAPGKTLNVRHKFMNVDIIGLGSTVVKKVKADPKKLEIDIDAVLKEPLILTGNYESVGKILTLPIRGDGKFNITLVNLKAVFKLKAHEIQKNGKRHVIADSVRFPFQVEKMVLNFEDLLKGNKEISATLNNVLNENWEPVLDDMKDSFEQAIGSAFKEIANRILTKVPISELIKD